MRRINRFERYAFIVALLFLLAWPVGLNSVLSAAEARKEGFTAPSPRLGEPRATDFSVAMLTSKSGSDPPAAQAQPGSPPPADYDEQIGVTFTQSFTSLGFNVTATAQTGSSGYGPAYLLNALSNTGYWYQVGLSYNWWHTTGGYHSGFRMNYEVFAPNGASIFPSSGSGGLIDFTGNVYPGDLVWLSLYFTQDDQEVVMRAQDLNTGAYASETFGAEGADQFVGLTNGKANAEGFFTGLMTEECHVNPYYGSQEEVVYSEEGFQLTSAWLWADEFNLQTKSTVFTACTQSPIPLSSKLYAFESNGALALANSTTFITGVPTNIPLQFYSFSSASESVDQGMNSSISFSAVVFGGTRPYSFYLEIEGQDLYLGSTSDPSFNYTIPFTATHIGTHPYCVLVQDSLGQTVKSENYTLTINPDPTVTLSGQTVYDEGQYLNVVPLVSGGTPPYSYVYYLDGLPVSGQAPLDEVGQGTLYVVVTDGVGYSARSNSLGIQVNAHPTATVTYSRNEIDVGLPVDFKASAAGGTPPYSYSWLVNGRRQSDTSDSFDLNASAPGGYNVSLTVTDSLGSSVSGSGDVEVTADPTLNGYHLVESSDNLLYSDNQASLSVSVTGGMPPYTYCWYLNGAEIARTSTPSYAYDLNAMGQNSVRVVIVDAAGYRVSSPPLTVNYGYNYFLFAAIAIVVFIIFGVALALRRRGSAGNRPSAQPPSGPTGTPESKPEKALTPEKMDLLLKLKELLDKGVITKEEFEEQKKKILET